MGRRPGRPDAWRSWYSSSGIFRIAVDPGLSVAAPSASRRALGSPFVLPLAYLAAAHGSGRPACGDALRAGWLARQAAVSGGQEVDCGGYQEEMEPCQQIVYSQMIADPDSIEI